MRAELSEQDNVLNNFRFTILGEIGQDLADTSFQDDENASTVERVQAAIAAYFSHQEKLREELEVRYIDYIKWSLSYGPYDMIDISKTFLGETK